MGFVEHAPARAAWLLVAGALGCAPGGAGPVDASGARECAIRLEPRSPATRNLPGAGARREAPLSQIVVHAEAPLAPLKELLEKRIPKRLAEGKVGIGPGGKVSYQAERGSLKLSVTTTALVIETPVQARAEACRGDDCYASCSPEALVRAEVPLMLGPDYRFAPSSVTLRFTRGCKVRALGGFLTIDVTPTLESQLAPELARAAREIDGQLPNVKREVERSWPELATPRSLPLVGCLVLSPLGIVQGPFSPSTERLEGRFAVLARPELRPSCPESSTLAAAPALESDPKLPEEAAVQLGMVTPLRNLAQALVSAGSFETSSQRLRVERADIAARNSDVSLELHLAGRACGSAELQAAPDFSGEGQHIGLSRARFADSDRERLEAAELDPAALEKSLQALPRLAPLLSVSGFRSSAPTLAAALTRPEVKVSATVSSARAAGAAARDEELVAWLEARGSLKLELTNLVR
jgi:hypothetical protein